MRRLIPAWLLAVAAPALAAPPVVTSAGPDKVAVTLYRDPSRGSGEINRSEPTGFALIAETRTIELPPGEVTVRFEGVAGGVVPQSAILFGTSPRERNRDAALLSQKGLVDSFTGQSVILRRTDPATGKVSEERATVRSAADRLVVTTTQGSEAVYCSGLAQTLIYPGVPESLSAKPVLSMTTKNQPGGRVTVTLAYIATGFDWDATYVGTLADDGKSLALLSWLTMASGDETSFIDAQTNAVAGRINRSDETRDDTARNARNDARWLNKASACWPAGRTHQLPTGYPPPPPPPPPPAAPAIYMEMAGADMVVTAARMKSVSAPIAVTAVSEALGDLKLYRIPVPVTVAAQSQKQVAFLNAEKIRGELVYRSKAYGDSLEDPQMLFRFRNRKAEGLGDPLPAGKVVLYQDSQFGRQVVGESDLADKAVDEEVEIVFGRPTGVTAQIEQTREGKAGYAVAARLKNANPFPVRYEIEFPSGSDWTFRNLPKGLLKKPGKQIWAVTIPAGGEVKQAWKVTRLGEVMG